MRLQAQIDQLEAEYSHELRAVQRRASAREEIVAMMNHDIRTPLTSLKGSLRLLAQGSVSPEEGRALTAEMGGWVSVQSELGHGATFQILLPLHAEAP